jgi:hypothetical protein
LDRGIANKKLDADWIFVVERNEKSSDVIKMISLLYEIMKNITDFETNLSAKV